MKKSKRKPTELQKENLNKDTSDTASKKENLPYNPEVTPHDLDILKQENIHGDGGDDQQLREHEDKVDFTGSELDVPGRNETQNPDPRELPDEENELYSRGADNSTNQE